MKRFALSSLLAVPLLLATSAFAAPTAILTQVSGSVVVQRGAQKLVGKAGLALQQGDRVVVGGGSATVFALGSPPRTLKSGSLVVGGAVGAKSGSPALWRSVHNGLQRGLNPRDTLVAATMRPGQLSLVSPLPGTLLAEAPLRFEWQTSKPAPRYEVVVSYRGQQLLVKRTAATAISSAGLRLPPAQYGWRVVPLRLEKGGWIHEDGEESAANGTFTVAKAAAVRGIQADLGAINESFDKSWGSAGRLERGLARAALWYDNGFYQAALEELSHLPADTAVATLRQQIWLETDQDWRLQKPGAAGLPLVAEPSTGVAFGPYLALRPDGPVAIISRKTYVAPDRHFALQIPAGFCASRSALPLGAVSTEFGGVVQIGPDFTLVYGPARNFSGQDTLLRHAAKWLGKTSSFKGAALKLGLSKIASFRGFQARLTETDTVLGAGHWSGRAIEWRQGNEVFLFLYSSHDERSWMERTFRPTLDTLRLGADVPAAPKPVSEAQQLSEMQLALKDHEHWGELAAERAQTRIDRLGLEPASAPGQVLGQAPALPALEKARLATPTNSFERGQASLELAHALTLAAGQEMNGGEDDRASQLFARSVEMEKEGRRLIDAAYRAELALIDARLAFWTARTPIGADAPIYARILSNYRATKAQWLERLLECSGPEGTANSTEQERLARQIFELRRLEWQDIRLLYPDRKESDFYPLRLLVAGAFENLGRVAKDRADRGGAAAYFERALAWRQSMPATYTERNVHLALQKLGQLEFDLGDMRLARTYFQRAATEMQGSSRAQERLAKADADNREYNLASWQAARADNCNSLGLVLQSLGQYGQSEAQFRQGLQFLKMPQGGDYKGDYETDELVKARGVILGNLSSLLVASGDAVKAASLLRESTAMLRRLGDPRLLATALFNQATVANFRRDPETAAAKFDEALQLFTLLGDQRGIITTQNSRALLKLGEGDVVGARRLATDALSRSFSIQDDKSIGESGRVLANVEIGAAAQLSRATGGRLTPEIRSVLDDLMAEIERADNARGSAQDNLATLETRSTYAALKGETGKALEIVMAAISRYEGMLPPQPGGQEYALWQGNTGLYTWAAELLLQLNRPSDAFDMLSRLRSKKLRDTFAVMTLGSSEPLLGALLQRNQALAQQLSKAQSELDKALYLGTGPRDDARIANLRQTVAASETELQRVGRKIKALNPRFSGVLSMARTDLKAVQKSLPQGTVLLQYVPLREKFAILAVTRNSVRTFDSPVSQDDLQLAIRSYRTAIEEDLKRLAAGGAPLSIDDPTTPLRGASEQISQWLLEPVKAEIKSAQTVVVMPVGQLFYLPFHALGRADANGKWHFLIEDKAVVTQARSDSSGLGRTAPSGRKGLLALGDPTGAQLPAAKLEVQSIARLYPNARAFTGAAASKTRLFQAVNQKERVLHLAAHGVLNSVRPEQSYIQLAPSKSDDGKLRVGDIVGLDLRRVDLVTLSACQTALGEGSADGTEISSLAQSFSTAGAPSVIASLWNVEDQSTRKLMEVFYSALAKGTPKGAALQKAQVALLKDGKTRHPVFWAAFELMGDWR
jgi:CHAT domain-containing protein